MAAFSTMVNVAQVCKRIHAYTQNARSFAQSNSGNEFCSEPSKRKPVVRDFDGIKTWKKGLGEHCLGSSWFYRMDWQQVSVTCRNTYVALQPSQHTADAGVANLIISTGPNNKSRGVSSMLKWKSHGFITVRRRKKFAHPPSCSENRQET